MQVPVLLQARRVRHGGQGRGRRPKDQPDQRSGATKQGRDAVQPGKLRAQHEVLPQVRYTTIKSNQKTAPDRETRLGNGFT